eukprot:UN14453
MVLEVRFHYMLNRFNQYIPIISKRGICKLG